MGAFLEYNFHTLILYRSARSCYIDLLKCGTCGSGHLPRTLRYIMYVPYVKFMSIVLKSLFFSPLDMWFRPTITGSPPPACHWCSLTRVDHHRAVLFGGKGKDNERILPDVYILDANHWVSSSSLFSLISII